MKTDYSQSQFKVMARAENIRLYRAITGRNSIPRDRGYWTLCNTQPREEGSEIVQMVSSGMIFNNQFFGVDNSAELIAQNRLWHPKATWIAGEWVSVISKHPDFNPGMVYLDTTSFADHDNAVRLTVSTMLRCKAGTVLLANVMLNDPRSRKTFDADGLLRSIEKQIPPGELSKWETEVQNYVYSMTRYTRMGTFVLYKRGAA